jgi:hypothetical protein
MIGLHGQARQALEITRVNAPSSSGRASVRRKVAKTRRVLVDRSLLLVAGRHE